MSVSRSRIWSHGLPNLVARWLLLNAVACGGDYRPRANGLRAKSPNGATFTFDFGRSTNVRVSMAVLATQKRRTRSLVTRTWCGREETPFAFLVPRRQRRATSARATPPLDRQHADRDGKTTLSGLRSASTLASQSKGTMAAHSCRHPVQQLANRPRHLAEYSPAMPNRFGLTLHPNDLRWAAHPTCST